MANFCAKNAFFLRYRVEDLHSQDSRTVLSINNIGQRLSLFGFGLVFRYGPTHVLLNDNPLNLSEFLKKLLHISLTETKLIRNRYSENTHRFLIHFLELVNDSINRTFIHQRILQLLKQILRTLHRNVRLWRRTVTVRIVPPSAGWTLSAHECYYNHTQLAFLY